MHEQPPSGRRKRARARAIFDELERLRIDFDRNVREDPTRVVVSPAEMEGMPEAYVRAHEPHRDKDGMWLVHLSPAHADSTVLQTSDEILAKLPGDRAQDPGRRP